MGFNLSFFVYTSYIPHVNILHFFHLFSIFFYFLFINAYIYIYVLRYINIPFVYGYGWIEGTPLCAFCECLNCVRTKRTNLVYYSRAHNIRKGFKILKRNGFFPLQFYICIPIYIISHQHPSYTMNGVYESQSINVYDEAPFRSLYARK